MVQAKEKKDQYSNCLIDSVTAIVSNSFYLRTVVEYPPINDSENVSHLELRADTYLRCCQDTSCAF